jgi:hypothetical protein
MEGLSMGKRKYVYKYEYKHVRPNDGENIQMRECLGALCVDKPKKHRLFASTWAGERMCKRCRSYRKTRNNDQPEE